MKNASCVKKNNQILYNTNQYKRKKLNLGQYWAEIIEALQNYDIPASDQKDLEMSASGSK